jgi:hypothetical protein
MNRHAARNQIAVVCMALGLAACSSGPDPSTLGRLGWMVGCWRSADASNQETWSAPSGGVMFGYATTIQNGQLAFFEQSGIVFENAQHDYPQRINYRPDGDGRLAATISLLDGGRPTEYRWERCR